MGVAEVLLWCAASLAVGMILVIRAGGPVLFNDSYQYLSAAEHIATDGRVETSLVHFDVERSSGELPAPLTTFPPGYPAAIAGLSRLGLSLEVAGLVCSLLSYVLMIPVLGWAGRQLGLGPRATRLAFVWLIGNAYMARHSVRVMTEPLFTLISLAALALLMSYERGSGSSRRSVLHAGALVTGCVLVGLAYWVRYAGLLLFATVVAFYGGRQLVCRNRRSVTELYGMAIAAAMIGAGFIRNMVLTGTWTGGNNRPVSRELASVVHQLAGSVHDLFLGKEPCPHLEVAEAALLIAAGALLCGGLWLRRAVSWQPCGPLWLLCTYLLVYTAGMLYVGVSSCVSIVMRMFYPVLPVSVLILTVALSRIVRASRASVLWRSVAVSSAVLLTAVYLFLNGLGMQVEQPVQPHHVVESRLAGATAAGSALRAWIDATIADDAVVVATDAQATGYVLGRETVGLLGSRYSVESWDGERVFALMKTYDAEYLILYPGADAQAVPVQAESRFVAGLLRGDEVPAWLTLAAENEDARIFRRLPARSAEPRLHP